LSTQNFDRLPLFIFTRKAKDKKQAKEALAKLALRAKFDDFDVGSIFRKLTYPIGHRRFAKNSNPTLKAQI
jgi:hypothetical protein